LFISTLDDPNDLMVAFVLIKKFPSSYKLPFYITKILNTVAINKIIHRDIE
jgi:hypothetical protein